MKFGFKQNILPKTVWLLIPTMIAFCAFWLIPFGYLVVLGTLPDQSNQKMAYWSVISQPHYLTSFITTFVISALVAIIAVLISTTIAYFLARQHFVGKKLLLTLLTFPIAFPGAVVGFFIIMLGGRQGVFAQLGQALGMGKIIFAYSLVGLFLGYLYFSIPRVIMTLVAACEKIDIQLEEAARSLGASRWRVVKDVIIPSLSPAIVSSMAICFATSIGAFGTAFTLGTDLNVLPLTIYGEFTNYANFTVSAALSVLMGLICWFTLIITRKLTGNSAGSLP
ncbi:ABC transporter permease [Acinetobacter boissieri]|uniref:Putative spermidine/putrescine transport system permease protein n=1 Tax=Acinetobacter boissieri TaxID=1219383 RepID=A0A1G6H212_9GAMM|nr:ABC transporter permease [Acinetobacter boissieri]SDB87935.1 putative spermidine/putrescine transport system permease protein [Acinetobacter boissieri]